ncbi:MAG: hypothetical protein K2G37_05295 [Clostridia bacterium]|nr:hypothetical protein [Clostridia bacterium]MDE7328598.1 hypothetical protein [Clostridia bacterium]
MKLLFRICFFILLPIILIVGLTLIITGAEPRGMVLAIGIPSILVGYFIIWFIMPDKKKEDQSNTVEQSDKQLSALNEIEVAEDTASNAAELSGKEKEQAALNAINSSKYYSSQMKMAEYEARHVKEGMKNATPKGMAFGIIYFLFLVADAVAATVLFIKHIFIGAIICAAIFAVVIIATLITVVVIESMSLNANISKAKKFVCGEIKSCIMSSTRSVKTNSNVRVRGVVYRVVVKAEDGAQYTAYSRRFYEKGEPVLLAIIGLKLAKIVEENNLENQTNTLENQNDKDDRL